MMVAMALSGAAAGALRREPSQQTLPPIAEIDAYVGQRLRSRREALGLSQGRLGRLLGVTFSQVQKYEKGANRIGAGRLHNAAAVLGVPVLYFFEGLGEPWPAEASKWDATAAAEAARLQEAFARISDPSARQALLSLASSMAG